MVEGDPVTSKETIDASNEAMQGYNITLKDAGTAFGYLTNVVQDSVKNLMNYNNNIVKAGSSNANTTSLNKETANSFAFLTSQVIGTSKAYENLKFTNISSITEQTQKMWAVISSGKNTLSSVAGVATSFLGTLGLPIEGINKIVNSTGNAQNKMSGITKLVSGQIETFTRAADNSLRLRDTYFQMAGANGGLSEALAKSGPNFKNVNELVQEQMNRINNSTKATNLSKEQMIDYFNSLGKIPGALNEQIKTTEKAGGTLDGLIARTRLAAATGRDTASVINDTTKALQTYNISGSDALKFVSRMSELSDKFNMEFSDTQKYMQDTAGTFKFIGNEAEGSAKMFNKLMTSFKETGLSAKASTDLIQGITDRIGGLSIAQKSFLSSQTGGAGGLVGGFQIEKMLREGKLDEVFDKVKSQMTKQFGKIVSLDEASNSPQAASQLVRQRALLQQGPLGQFAKNDNEAQRILDAFSKGSKIDVKELTQGDKLLNTNLELGKSWQDKNITIIKQTNDILEDIKDQGSTVTNNLLEKILTGDSSKQMRDTLSANEREGIKKVNDVVKNNKSHNTSAADMSKNIRQAGRVIRTVPDVASSAIEQSKLMMSHTASTKKNTGVASASDSEKNNDDYMNLFNKGRENNNIKRWTEAQNMGANESDRFVNTKEVGNVNTSNANTTNDRSKNNAHDRNSQHFGTVKVDPITVKVVVDATGVARVEHTQQAQAAMNLPNGGRTP